MLKFIAVFALCGILAALTYAGFVIYYQGDAIANGIAGLAIGAVFMGIATIWNENV